MYTNNKNVIPIQTPTPLHLPLFTFNFKSKTNRCNLFAIHINTLAEHTFPVECGNDVAPNPNPPPIKHLQQILTSPLCIPKPPRPTRLYLKYMLMETMRDFWSHPLLKPYHDQPPKNSIHNSHRKSNKLRYCICLVDFAFVTSYELCFSHYNV